MALPVFCLVTSPHTAPTTFELRSLGPVMAKLKSPVRSVPTEASDSRRNWVTVTGALALKMKLKAVTAGENGMVTPLPLMQLPSA